MEGETTRYARTVNGDGITYQVVGDGPIDIVYVPGFVPHVDRFWDDPAITTFYNRLASFSRLILFDKRGTGLSDPLPGPQPLKERFRDVGVVMDAAGSERAVVVGLSEGCAMAAVFAATYPERTQALVLCGTILGGPASSTVKELVLGSGIVFEDRGTRTLKGVPDQWRLYAVIDDA